MLLYAFVLFSEERISFVRLLLPLNEVAPLLRDRTVFFVSSLSAHLFLQNVVPMWYTVLNVG